MQILNVTQLVGGHRLGIRPDSVEAVMEEERGCTLVTGSDVYRVKESYDEVMAFMLAVDKKGKK